MPISTASYLFSIMTKSSTYLSPRSVLVLVLATLSAICTAAAGSPDFIVVQSTTSTQNSGLYAAILPQFRAQTGIEVRVVAVGTGQAIKNAKNCDGDVVIVHSTPDEERFVAEGFGVSRSNLMYNDFVIVGPPSDPAAISKLRSAATALNGTRAKPRV